MRWYSLAVATIDDVRAYWNRHIHDLEITQASGRLARLLRRSRSVSISRSCITCFGSWTLTAIAADRFSKSAAAPASTWRASPRAAPMVTGVDLAASAIDLARANFEQQGLRGRFEVADGERLPFPDNTFDLVYAHGVVQYTADPQRLVDECRRVLKPGGEAVFQVYNRDFVAERAVEADEGRPRARRRAGAAEVQHRRVPPAARAVSATCGSCPSVSR
mgnify:CR=1 FL=1